MVAPGGEGDIVNMLVTLSHLTTRSALRSLCFDGASRKLYVRAAGQKNNPLTAQFESKPQNKEAEGKKALNMAVVEL